MSAITRLSPALRPSSISRCCLPSAVSRRTASPFGAGLMYTQNQFLRPGRTYATIQNEDSNGLPNSCEPSTSTPLQPTLPAPVSANEDGKPFVDMSLSELQTYWDRKKKGTMLDARRRRRVLELLKTLRSRARKEGGTSTPTTEVAQAWKPRDRQTAEQGSEGGDRTFLGEEYYKQRLPLPTPETYPRVSKDLFVAAWAPEVIMQAYAVNGISCQLDAQFSNYSAKELRSGDWKTLMPRVPRVQSRKSRDIKITHCSLTLKLPSGESYTAVGDGVDQKLAKRAAWVELCSKLHVSGELIPLFRVASEIDSVSGIDADVPVKLEKGVMNDEADAKIDIYNYAAGFGLVPKFQVSLQEPRKSVQKRLGARRLAKVSISLPEQNIEVTAAATSFKVAEIAAALKFKKQAEAFHRENADEIRESAKNCPLTTDTAKQFFDLYKMLNPTTTLEVETEKTNEKVIGDQITARLSLQDFGISPSITMGNKKDAEAVVYLVAAVELVKQQPELLETFLDEMRKGQGKILRPIAAIDMAIDPDAALIMRDALIDVRRAGLSDVKEPVKPEDRDEGRYFRSKGKMSADRARQRSEELLNRMKVFEEDDKLAELREKKASLPMNHYRKPVLDLISGNLYSIVVGATGSGKTTQVPQILLEDAIARGEGAFCNIVCTQPRRIAATSVAQRVAVERNEPLRDTVGYHVRFDVKHPKTGGSVLYCTTGIVLEQLKRSADEVLDNISHLVIDEVHERDMNIDFLMIVLKKAIKQRQQAGKSVPKVVLMSATLDTELFAGYFSQQNADGSSKPCPSISVPGRTFPVKERYFEDIMQELEKSYPNDLTAFINGRRAASADFVSAERALIQRDHSDHGSVSVTDSAIHWKRDRSFTSEQGFTVQQEREEGLVPVELMAATIGHICNTTQQGAILAFLPGLDEIVKVSELLDGRLPGSTELGSKVKVFPLHSSVPKEAQSEVFEAVPEGVRKIILSTNIAETSVTIPDVQYVVDCGKQRELRYDQVRRITKLQTTWVSKSNSKQRAGRAGRVQNGNYYALFSRARFDSLRVIGLPELLRSDLQETCLAIKAQSFNEPVQDFLAQAIEPPPNVAVQSALQSLKALEALTLEEELTPLGRLLSKLPILPALGKMIVLGVIFRCLDPLLLLGAASEERDLFTSPLEARQEAKQSKRSYGESHSDHLAFVNAFRELRSLRVGEGQTVAYQHAREKFLHFNAFRNIDQSCQQIEEVLAEAGLIPRVRRDFHSSGIGYGGAELNSNSHNTALIKALLLAGHHPNLAVKQSSTGVTFRTAGETNVLMHPSSVNAVPRRKGKDSEEQFPYGTLFTFSTLARSVDGNSLFFRDSTMVSPLIASLFGGRLSLTATGRLEIDEWLPFFVKAQNRARTAKLLLEFRKALDRVSLLQVVCHLRYGWLT